jgi:hypothetical protein
MMMEHLVFIQTSVEFVTDLQLDLVQYTNAVVLTSLMETVIAMETF